VAKKLRILSTFKKDYKELPSEIKDKVDKQLEFLIRDPGHPSLNLHRIRGTKGLWEGYVDDQYRFTFEIERDIDILRKVGTHNAIRNP